jgi:hypothetical protein
MPAEVTLENKETLVEINRSKVLSSHTLDYLSKNKLRNSLDLDCLSPKCYKESDNGDFYTHSKTYHLNHSIEKVWDAYLNIPPKEAWSGSKLAFSFAYDPPKRNFTYTEDKSNGMRENQLVFIVIKLLFGIFKLAVTHFVSSVSKKDKKVKLCYVEGGKASGSQMINFEKISENETQIVHITRYKSDSKFRDEKLYPIIHEMIINAFHKNVKKYLEAQITEPSWSASF